LKNADIQSKHATKLMLDYAAFKNLTKINKLLFSLNVVYLTVKMEKLVTKQKDLPL
jgi:hypothetical protein